MTRRLGVMSPLRVRGLNPQQREAVQAVRGAVLVFAGAGTGKTRVITHRIQEMVGSGIPPSSIVAVTFTNRSAREMKERLSKMMKRPQLRGMIVSTFHSLGNRILKEEITRLPGYRLPFSILSQDDALALLSDIYRELKLDPSTIRDDGILFRLSLCKNSGQSPEAFAEDHGPEADLFLEIHDRYTKALRANNAVDFDDLILLPQRIFASHPEALARFHRKHQHFLVDEFQDTNPTQYSLLRLLVGEGRNLCVVGDDDQSIYGWRGADVSIIRNFRRDFRGAAEIRLEWNYRSTAVVLEAANAVIANNTGRVDKELKPTSERGRPIVQLMCEDETDEAAQVAVTIEELLRKDHRRPADIALLYRTNYQSRAFEMEFRRRGIPHHVIGAYRFFDRSEVKDLVAYLRAIANPRDELSLKRIINRPRRGIGATSLGKLHDHLMGLPDENRPALWDLLVQMMAEPGLVRGIKPDTVAAIVEFAGLLERLRREFAQAKRLTDAMRTLLAEVNFEAEFRREGGEDKAVTARMMNLSELVNMAAQFEESARADGEEPDLFGFLGRLSLMATDNDDENPSGRVHLLSFHLAKGLEYPVVFLTGLEEGLLPAARSLSESADPEASLQEERRLFYVGITRAREELFLTLAAGRRKFGEMTLAEPSRFLSEIPPELLEVRGVAEARENALTGLLAGLDKMRGP